MKTRFAGYAEKARASFDRQDMMRALQARMTDIAPGRATLRAPILDAFRQQHGFAHAAVSFALGDSAAGYAALTLMAEPDEVLTAEMKINLLAPARGEHLVAHGRVIRAGRRLIVVTAEVLAVAGGRETPVALLQGTMIPVGR